MICEELVARISADLEALQAAMGRMPKATADRTDQDLTATERDRDGGASL